MVQRKLSALGKLHQTRNQKANLQVQSRHSGDFHRESVMNDLWGKPEIRPAKPTYWFDYIAVGFIWLGIAAVIVMLVLNYLF